MMSETSIPPLPFMKMHGLGNDFVVIDARARDVVVTARLAMALADRHRGVGFDQLAVVRAADGAAGARLEFYNSDGSLAGACGNATRCIARWLMQDSGQTALHLVTERGVLAACDAGGGLTSVNMGHPMTDWWDVPLASEMDTIALPIEGRPVATGMGNPHCTFFVDDAEAVDLAAFGPQIEHHSLFPERTNVQVASLLAPDRIRMRVWERGVGITLASGSSSCATAVAAVRLGKTARAVTVVLDGGALQIDWREDGIWMTGPTSHVFDGQLSPAWLADNA